MAIVWIHETSLANNLSVINNAKGSGSIVYLPIIMDSSIPEICANDPDPCPRWPYYPGQTLYISYKWGENLLTPGLPWRDAFEAGLYSWNFTNTPVWYYYNSNSSNVINTYDYPYDGFRGKTDIYYIGTTTISVEIYGNLFWDAQDQYTILERRGIATHEIGHGISIGHIPNEYPYIALMYDDIVLETFNSIYDPQPTDENLVNQVYPKLYP